MQQICVVNLIGRMTVDLDYIKAKVKEISELSGDDEAAHSREDRLHVEFITHIAENWHGELAEMAKEVLKTNAINFSRWCA